MDTEQFPNMASSPEKDFCTATWRHCESEEIRRYASASREIDSWTDVLIHPPPPPPPTFFIW